MNPTTQLLLWIAYALLGSLLYTTHKQGKRIRELANQATIDAGQIHDLTNTVDLVEKEVDVLIERFGQ